MRTGKPSRKQLVLGIRVPVCVCECVCVCVCVCVCSMFRVADIQPRPVTNAQIRALLYTWGPGGTGRITAEGDRIPVTMQVRLQDHTHTDTHTHTPQTHTYIHTHAKDHAPPFICAYSCWPYCRVPVRGE